MREAVAHVRKKDLVQVMVGQERGKTGKILRVDHKHGRVLIEKLNLVKRHTKPSNQKPGGIVEKEAPIAVSNVLLYCTKCNSGRKTKLKAVDGGKKMRVCKRCDTQLDK